MADGDDLLIGVDNYSAGGNNNIQVCDNDFRGFKSVQVGVGNYARGSNTIIVGGPRPPSGLVEPPRPPYQPPPYRPGGSYGGGNIIPGPGPRMWGYAAGPGPNPGGMGYIMPPPFGDPPQ